MKTYSFVIYTNRWFDNNNAPLALFMGKIWLKQNKKKNSRMAQLTRRGLFTKFLECPHRSGAAADAELIQVDGHTKCLSGILVSFLSMRARRAMIDLSSQRRRRPSNESALPKRKKNWSPPFHSSRFLLTSRWADGINQKRLIKCHIFISLGDDDEWVHFGSSRRPLMRDSDFGENNKQNSFVATRYRTHH